MICFPNAKINLGLNILNKRNDGYHNLETVFFPVPWCDILEIIVCEKNEKTFFKSTGNEIPGSENNNLCLKAYNLLKEEFELSEVRIHLHKIIPSGAGLGGGSSDAAFTLLTLNQLFQLGLSNEKLISYALKLGSDCPFFIENSPVFASGRGEVMEPINLSLPGYYIVLVMPKVHVSTAMAFKGIQPEIPPVSLSSLVQEPIKKWKSLIKNDFEQTIFKNFPEIAELKERLYKTGAIYASMSGSGACVYGIFENESRINFEAHPDEIVFKKKL